MTEARQRSTPAPKVKRSFSGKPSLSLAVLAILCISVALGFLFDALCTVAEKRFYPRQYDTYVSLYAAQYGVPEHMIYAVIRTESAFDTGARSSAGAVGLMQLMPDTFQWLTNEILFEHLESGMLYDPETNIRYGTYMLSRLYARYGDWTVALAAYNAGTGIVDEWLADASYADGNGGLKKIPYRETRQYVAKVTKAVETYDRLYMAD
jgi:soluble lytic murein transglycosylase